MQTYVFTVYGAVYHITADSFHEAIQQLNALLA